MVKARLLLSISAPLRGPLKRQHFTIQKSLMVRRTEKNAALPICPQNIGWGPASSKQALQAWTRSKSSRPTSHQRADPVTCPHTGIQKLAESERNRPAPSLTYTVTSRRGRSSQPDSHLIVSNLRMRSPILLGLPRGSSSPSGQLY